MLHDDGRLHVRSGADIPRLRPDASVTARRRSEILIDYGDAYWREPAHAALLAA